MVVAAVAATAVLLFLRTLSHPDEATARFVPSSAAAYVSINLRPGISQLRTARNVMDRLLTDDLLDRRDELLDDLEDETGIHFLDDVTPWLGTDLSLILLSFDPDRPEWVILAQVRDRSGAEDFIDDLVDYFEEEFYTEFDSGRRRGVDLWVAEGRGPSPGTYGRLPAYRRQRRHDRGHGRQPRIALLKNAVG